LCSSRIEGAEVTFSELLLDQVSAAPASVSRVQMREVRDCVATLRYGVARLAETPLSLELMRELHERLLRGEVGNSRTPGEFRTSQNWIGPPGATLAPRPTCAARAGDCRRSRTAPSPGADSC
jgi:Fic family protein